MKEQVIDFDTIAEMDSCQDSDFLYDWFYKKFFDFNNKDDSEFLEYLEYLFDYYNITTNQFDLINALDVWADLMGYEHHLDSTVIVPLYKQLATAYTDLNPNDEDDKYEIEERERKFNKACTINI